MDNFPHLLSPFDFGFLKLRNRVVMGSMHVGLEDDPAQVHKLAAFFERRAAAGVGLLITGGYAPNKEGRLHGSASLFDNAAEAQHHTVVTQAVRNAGGHIVLQLLHAGRYAWHDQLVAPSPLRSPINALDPRELSSEDIERTIQDFAAAAALARDVGYHGVEIMGSEGYLLNQFIVRRTNHRTDNWGGSLDNRIRFPLEVVRACRKRAGEDFLLLFRLSLLDLVEEGSTWEEVVVLAQAVETAGANILNTGIGWHEARVPTIAMCVPRGAFTWTTARLRQSVRLPVVATNRLNTPEIAEQVLANGEADFVSIARPLLADPDLLNKAAQGKCAEINTCIACNQACLDQVFSNRRASCLVNPRACFETELSAPPSNNVLSVAVVGAGPGGLAAAIEAADRGHKVTLFEAADRLGGQLNLAVQIPGKQELRETLRYFRERLDRLGVRCVLKHSVQPQDLKGFEAIVIATGVYPRRVDFAGSDNPKVVSYVDILQGTASAGRRVAILGGGGIGFDVAEFLTHEGVDDSQDKEAFLRYWGVDQSGTSAGGLLKRPPVKPCQRQLFVLQRRPGKPGGRLGKTTGWVARARLESRGVELLGGVRYLRFDDQGLHVTVMNSPRLLEVDTVVVCAGQVPNAGLLEPARALGARVTVVGGAARAEELDARRAIREGVEAALAL